VAIQSGFRDSHLLHFMHECFCDGRNKYNRSHIAMNQLQTSRIIPASGRGKRHANFAVVIIAPRISFPRVPTRAPTAGTINMNKPLLLIIPLMMLRWSSLCPAADDARLAALRAADDERVAVTVAPDKARLEAIFSDDLRYAHSTGSVDTKRSYIDLLVSGRSKYLSYEYQEKNFTFPAPGIALMTGRVHLKNASEGRTTEVVLGFLAVWREENGKWRFLAWQSCKLPPPAPAAK
jgi:hypothetical protein